MKLVGTWADNCVDELFIDPQYQVPGVEAGVQRAVQRSIGAEHRLLERELGIHQSLIEP